MRETAARKPRTGTGGEGGPVEDKAVALGDVEEARDGAGPGARRRRSERRGAGSRNRSSGQGGPGARSWSSGRRSLRTRR
eukprot:7231355-Alexandrium_andersonii.AAC.1